jgi:hypothetical protein
MVWWYCNEELLELVALEESKFYDDKSKNPITLMKSWRMSIEELMLMMVMKEKFFNHRDIQDTRESLYKEKNC